MQDRAENVGQPDIPLGNEVRLRLTISKGATIQLITKLNPSCIQTPRSEKTLCNVSNLTRHKIGYIMTSRPTAIGTETSTSCPRCKACSIPGTKLPKSIPMMIARRIHSASNRSSQLRPLYTGESWRCGETASGLRSGLVLQHSGSRSLVRSDGSCKTECAAGSEDFCSDILGLDVGNTSNVAFLDGFKSISWVNQDEKSLSIFAYNGGDQIRYTVENTYSFSRQYPQ